MPYFVYILTTRKNTVLYTGVTNNPEKRQWEHQQGEDASFTKRYNVNKLVHLEEYADSREAIHREKCIKKWNRAWKIELIEKANPEWRDLLSADDNQIPASAGMTKG